MDRHERFDRAEVVIQIGLWSNALLMVMKLTAGYVGRSDAVLADGFESAADLVVMLSTMVALRIGRRPYDRTHPYGHGRVEHIAAIIVAIVIFATGGWILVSAVRSVLGGVHQRPEFLAVAAAVLTIAAKEALARYSLRAGKNLGSPAIEAVAKDHRKDALTSVGTLAGVTAAYFGLEVMDPIAAGVTAFFIFHIGYGTFREAAHDLMDGCVSEDFVGDVTRAAEGVAGVEHVHEIRCRRSGQYVIIDLKLDMDPEMTVRRSHAIATEVKRVIFTDFPSVGDVMIHINPHEEAHEDLIRL